MSDELFSRNYYEVLRRPLLTEKGQDMRDTENKYMFEVIEGANKVEIAQAVEKLFGVRVAKVNTQVMRGKMKRVGRKIGKRANWKKAIVTLHAGDAIDLFEGV
jgi:large subunit ribosomal protein L23